jgi:hypothetical protein
MRPVIDGHAVLESHAGRVLSPRVGPELVVQYSISQYIAFGLP